MKLVFESFTEAADFLKERSELRPSPILAGVYVAATEERSPEESAPPMFRPQCSWCVVGFSLRRLKWTICIRKCWTV